MPDLLTLSFNLESSNLEGSHLDPRETRPLIACAGRQLCEVEPGSGAALAVTRFIRRRFEQAYGARPRLQIPRLLALTAAQGTLLAAVGIRNAAEERLFLEDYLEVPAEVALPGALAVERGKLAEIAHLAGVEAGVSRYLFASLTLWIRAHGFQWIAFTATDPLCNRFRRMGIVLHPMAPADPSRLPDGGRGWGSYYHQRPVVMAVNVEEGYQAMARAGLLQRTQWLPQPQQNESCYVHSA